MNPSCRHCGQDIKIEGFDLTRDEWVCGICRSVARKERERIKAAYYESYAWNGVFDDEAIEFQPNYFERRIDGWSDRCADDCHTTCQEEGQQPCECSCHSNEMSK